MAIYPREDPRTTLPQLEKKIGELQKKLDSGGGILDMFYPVGSYYETSDDTFDPNVRWGGTWELEVAGQVHVSSGTGYSINGALTNESDGGNKDAAVISHYHNPSTTSEYFVCNSISEANNTRVAYSSSGNRLVDGLTSTDTSSFHHRKATQTVGESGTNRNMQPYIVINRWHRTA
jgi:hypothetical protein